MRLFLCVLVCVCLFVCVCVCYSTKLVSLKVASANVSYGTSLFMSVNIVYFERKAIVGYLLILVMIYLVTARSFLVCRINAI